MLKEKSMDFFLKNIPIKPEYYNGIKIVTIACISLIVVAFSVDLILCILNVGNFRKHKNFYLLVVGATCLINLAICLTACQSGVIKAFSLPIILLGVGVSLYVPIAFFNERVYVITNKDREFVKSVEESVKKEEQPVVDAVKPKSFTENNSFVERLERALGERKVEKITPKPLVKKQEERKKELNFDHVKNVLDRLKYYNLSPVDKRTVAELKAVLFEAEEYGVTDESKGKINEGLSSLLKIMSKYSM